MGYLLHTIASMAAFWHKGWEVMDLGLNQHIDRVHITRDIARWENKRDEYALR